VVVALVSVCGGPAYRESLPAPAAGSVHRARYPTAPARRGDTRQPGAIGRALRLARRAGGRAAGDDDPLAPRGLETPLANEVSSRSASDPARAPRADSQDARENVLWGEERIANELLLKLGVRISPRTVGKYLPKRPPGRRRGDLRWSTFLRNEATAVLACDFFVAVTATFRMLYVFVVIEHGTRRLAHVNVTTHRVRPGRCSSSEQGSETLTITST